MRTLLLLLLLTCLLLHISNHLPNDYFLPKRSLNFRKRILNVAEEEEDIECDGRREVIPPLRGNHKTIIIIG